MEKSEQKLNKKAIILDKKPNIFKESQLTKTLNISLPLDTEIKVISLLSNNSVKIILPNNIIGFISGDEELNIIQSAWITSDTQVYNDINNDVDQIIINQGQEIEIINHVDDNWLRIRLLEENDKHKFLFLKSNLEDIITEDNACEYIDSSINDGDNKDDIIKNLVNQGIMKSQAELLFNKTVDLIKEYESSPKWREDMRKGYSRRIFYGLLWAVGGIIATSVGYESASSGGSYYIFYGAIIYGIWDILSGLYGWVKYS